MRTGRQSGGADKSDHLALPHACAFVDVTGEGAHMPIGRLVAVVVADQDEFSITRFPASLFDRAVASGIDWRAGGCRPVHAGMHLGVAEDWMLPHAECRTHDAFGDRL